MLQIYYTHITGAIDYCGETDLDPEEWVKRNNVERWKDIACGGDEDHDNKECLCIEDVEEFQFIWKKEGKQMEYYPDLSFNEQEEFNKLINEYRVSDGTHFFIIDDKKDFKRYNYLIGKKLKHLKQKESK